MTTQTLEFRGHRVAMETTGRGPPVVLVHNAGNDHHNWDPQIASLSARHTVFAVDMLGFGASARPRLTYDLDLFASMVEAVCDHTRASRIDLVGHCVGGAACWEAARRQPARIRRLVLFSPATLSAMRAGPYGWIHRLSQSSSTGDRLATAVARASLASGLGRRLTVRTQFGQRGPDPAFSQHCSRLYSHPENLRVLRSVLRSFDSFRVLEDEPRPPGFPSTMLVWGTANRILPYSQSESVQRSLQPDRFEVLEGAGHVCMQERPEQVNVLLADFLDLARLDAATRTCAT